MSIPAVGAPVMMSIVVLTSTSPSSIALITVAALLGTSVAAALAVVGQRLALGWMFALGYLSVMVTWTVAPSVEHVVTFANCWMSNFLAISAALLLPGWRAIAMPALLAVTSGAALYAAQPDWDRILLHSNVVTETLIGIVGYVAIRYLRNFAAIADEEARIAERSRRAVAVAAAASRAAAHSARTLHDTVVNTLGAIANGGSIIQQRPLVRARCARDVAALESLLTGTESPGPAGFRDGIVALGRTVGVEVLWTTRSRRASPLWEQSVPADVGAALHGAIHEALLNIVKHSGTTVATVDLSITQDEVAITVHDDGAGFARDREFGYGLTESVLARCREHGIGVHIETAPRSGTSIAFTYSPNRPVRENGRATRDQVAATQRRACWAWAAGVVAVGVAIELSNRFGTLSLTWAMLALVAASSAVAWLACRGGRELPVGVAALLIVSTPAAFLLSFAGIDFGRSDPITWQLLGATVPPVILLYFARTATAFVLATASLALCGIGTSIVMWWHESPHAELALAGTVFTLPPLAGFVHFHAAVANIGERLLADERAAAADRRRLAVRKAAELARGRWQAAGLQSSVELLRRIAIGAMDPTHPSVRGECSREERYLRQLLTLSPELVYLGRWLTHASAQARESDIELIIRSGDLDAPDEDSARYLGGLLRAELDKAPAGSAMTVGVFPHPAGGCMVIVGDLSDGSRDQTGSGVPGRLTVTRLTYDTQFLLEAVWRAATPDGTP